MRRTRLVGLITGTLGIALALALAGCSLLPLGVAGAGASASSEPKVGDCWNASFANAGQWINWEGTFPVSCRVPHSLYTFKIGELRGFPSKSWASTTDPLMPTDAIQAAIEKACALTPLLPKLKWNQQLVQPIFFLPSKSQWAAGARWARCDVGVLRTGTLYNAQAFALLPDRIGTLASAVSSDPKRYDLCINTQDQASGSDGPLSFPGLVHIANCASNAQWALVGRGTLPDAVGSPFPSAAAAQTQEAQICSRYADGDDEVWYAYLPAETSTATVGTDREVTCWVGQTYGDNSGGSGGDT